MAPPMDAHDTIIAQVAHFFQQTVWNDRVKLALPYSRPLSKLARSSLPLLYSIVRTKTIRKPECIEYKKAPPSWCYLHQNCGVYLANSTNCNTNKPPFAVRDTLRQGASTVVCRLKPSLKSAIRPTNKSQGIAHPPATIYTEFDTLAAFFLRVVLSYCWLDLLNRNWSPKDSSGRNLHCYRCHP